MKLEGEAGACELEAQASMHVGHHITKHLLQVLDLFLGDWPDPSPPGSTYQLIEDLKKKNDNKNNKERKQVGGESMGNGTARFLGKLGGLAAHVGWVVWKYVFLATVPARICYL